MIYKLVKRTFDFICALLGIVGTSPIWIVSIILTELSDPGPLFYFANRVGRPFFVRKTCFVNFSREFFTYIEK